MTNHIVRSPEDVPTVSELELMKEQEAEAYVARLLEGQEGLEDRESEPAGE